MTRDEIVKQLVEDGKTDTFSFCGKEGLYYAGEVEFIGLGFNFKNETVTLVKPHEMSERIRYYFIPMKDLLSMKFCHHDRVLLISCIYKEKPRKFSIKLKFNQPMKRFYKKALVEILGDEWEQVSYTKRFSIGKCGKYYVSNKHNSKGEIINLYPTENFIIVENATKASRYHIYYDDIKNLESVRGSGEREDLLVKYVTNGVTRTVTL